MELAYLCRMRRNEILNATEEQILHEGFKTMRSKGSNDTITLCSDRLRRATEEANQLPTKIENIHNEKKYIVHDKYGNQISKSAFKSAWQRRQKKITDVGIESFNFHDLKAKGVSEFDGNKQDASDLKSESLIAVYDRKIKKVNATIY